MLNNIGNFYRYFYYKLLAFEDDLNGTVETRLTVTFLTVTLCYPLSSKKRNMQLRYNFSMKYGTLPLKNLKPRRNKRGWRIILYSMYILILFLYENMYTHCKIYTFMADFLLTVIVMAVTVNRVSTVTLIVNKKYNLFF